MFQRAASVKGPLALSWWKTAALSSRIPRSLKLWPVALSFEHGNAMLAPAFCTFPGVLGSSYDEFDVQWYLCRPPWWHQAAHSKDFTYQQWKPLKWICFSVNLRTCLGLYRTVPFAVGFCQYLQLRECPTKAGAPGSRPLLLTNIGSQIEHHGNLPHAVISICQYLLSEFSGVMKALKQLWERDLEWWGVGGFD